VFCKYRAHKGASSRPTVKKPSKYCSKSRILIVMIQQFGRAQNRGRGRQEWCCNGLLELGCEAGPGEAARVLEEKKAVSRLLEVLQDILLTKFAS